MNKIEMTKVDRDATLLIAKKCMLTLLCCYDDLLNPDFKFAWSEPKSIDSSDLARIGKILNYVFPDDN